MPTIIPKSSFFQIKAYLPDGRLLTSKVFPKDDKYHLLLLLSELKRVGVIKYFIKSGSISISGSIPAHNL